MALRFLRNHRNAIIQPNRVALPMAIWLDSFAELLRAVGREVVEERWAQVATVLDRAAKELRKLS